MREADMKGKVALSPSLTDASLLPFQADPAMSIRSGKVVADTTFCCKLKLDHCHFSAQARRAKPRMTGENSSQKSFAGQMSAYFAPGDTFAHFGPNTALLARLGYFLAWPASCRIVRSQ
jgi:hypothetical protein